MTLIRSVTSPEADHDRAAHHLLTGYRPLPGARLSRAMAASSPRRARTSRGRLPPYVAVPDAPIFSSSGYLTPAYDPFSVGGDPNQAGFRVRDLTPPDRLTLDRLRRRRGMVQSLDEFAHDVAADAARPPAATSSPTRRTTCSPQRRAGGVQDRRRARRPSATATAGPRSARRCLLARRLIEAGVVVRHAERPRHGPARLGHAPAELPDDQGHARPAVDQGSRGLAGRPPGPRHAGQYADRDDGRVRPHAQDQRMAGRDHHGRANCVLLAGAGCRGGSCSARPTPRATRPPTGPSPPPTSPPRSTRRLGIDPNHQFETPDGRPDPPRR